MHLVQELAEVVAARVAENRCSQRLHSYLLNILLPSRHPHNSKQGPASASPLTVFSEQAHFSTSSEANLLSQTTRNPYTEAVFVFLNIRLHGTTLSIR